MKIYCELLAPVDLSDCLSADLVGISSTTATQPSAYRLTDLLESAGVPVVLGGPHVSFRQDEALTHAHYVVRGEGQATMLELVHCLESGLDLGTVQGLSFRREDGEPCHNPGRSTTTQQQFAALPAPDLSLITGHERMTTRPIMTQWGCPFGCEFCSVTAMFSRRVRHRALPMYWPSWLGSRSREGLLLRRQFRGRPWRTDRAAAGDDQERPVPALVRPGEG